MTHHLEREDIGQRGLVESERADLEAAIEEARAAGRRHTTWALLGMSPGALVLIIAAGHEYGVVAALLASLGISGIEVWRGLKASRRVTALQDRLEDLDRSGSAG